MEIQWSLVAFTTITAAAGWLAACTAAAEFMGKAKKASFVAAVAVLVLGAVGGLASVTHLSHVENIMGAFGHPTSGIFTEALLTVLLCAFAFIYALLVKREAGAGARKAAVVLLGIVGIILSFSVGMSYMMASRPSWNTPLLPVGYLGTAIPLGVAVYMAIARELCPQEDLSVFGKGMLVGGVLAAITALAFGLSAGDAASGGAAMAMIALCLIFDGVAPIVVGLKLSKPEATGNGSEFSVILAALVCTVVGASCFRILMWLAATPIADIFGIAI